LKRLVEQGWWLRTVPINQQVTFKNFVQLLEEVSSYFDDILFLMLVFFLLSVFFVTVY
jgi:hypothetical protein